MNDVFDAVLFLVLVSAAVGTLAIPAHRPPGGSADDVAMALATSTAQVNYSIDAPDTAAVGTASAPQRSDTLRSARGTLVQLLAAAATRNVSIGEEPVAEPAAGFERAVVNATTNATGGGRRVAVDAAWEPYRDAVVSGQVHAGPRPPASEEVWAVSIDVDAGAPAARSRAMRAAESGGYVAVSRIVARAVVSGLFPPEATAVSLRSGGPSGTRARTRYESVAGILGVSVAGPTAAPTPRRANARLAAALAPRIEAELRSSFDTPAAAARTVSVSRVRVTVRTWSP